MVHGHVLSDFAKADAAWLDPLLDAIADHAGDLVSGDDTTFGNRIHLITDPKPARKPKPAGERAAPPPPASGAAPAAAPEGERNAMATMLRALLDRKPAGGRKGPR
jgi:PTH1 family peptidyl-tRNA hydrolase